MTNRTVKSIDKLLKISGLRKTEKPLASFRSQAAFRVVFGTRKLYHTQKAINKCFAD